MGKRKKKKAKPSKPYTGRGNPKPPPRRMIVEAKLK
jgi:hypothetical protein